MTLEFSYSIWKFAFGDGVRCPAPRVIYADWFRGHCGELCPSRSDAGREFRDRNNLIMLASEWHCILQTL